MAASFNLVSAPMSSAPTPKSMSESFYPYLGSTATLVSAQPAFSAGYHSPLYFTSPTPRHSQTESSFGGQSSSPLSWWSIYSALQPAVKSVHDSLPLMTSYYHSTSSGTIPNSAMSSNKSSTLSKPSVQLSGSPQSNRSEVVCSQFGEQNLAPSLDSPELIGRALDEQWTLVNDSNIKLAKRPLAASIGMPPRRSVLATLGPVTVVSGPRGSIHSDSSPLKSLPSSPTRARTGGSRPIRSSDVLLDRKAFISLEKSINWQSLLDDSIEANTGGVTLTDTNESSAIHDGENNRKAPNGEQCDANDTNKEGSTSLEFTLPGMRDVPAWLKLLRLHKYAPLFAHMSYEEMLRLSDEDLASRHITKGARQKLYLSIQKLKARAAVLRASERELLTEDLRHYRASLPHPLLSQVLFQVRAFLSTPIRPDSRPPNASSVSGNSPPTASHLSLVDFNNNTSGSHQPHQCTANSNLLEPRYLTQCWSALATDQLPDIITRLIGHDNLACVNITAKDEMKTIEVLSEFSDKEENEDDEESSLEDEMLLRGKDKDKDSGVEDGPVESDESALLVEQEEELHSMMKTILDKCLSHEAFLVHQPLLLHWREQSLYLFASLRCLRTECLVNSSSAGAKEGKAYFSPDVFHRHTLHNHSTLNYRNCRSPALSKRKLGTFQSPKSSGVVASGHQVSSWTHHSTRRHSKMPEEKMATRVLLSDRRNPNASNWSTDPDLKPHTISQQPLNQPVLAGANLSVIQNLSNTSHSMGVGSTISGPEVENLPEHNLRNMLLQQFLVATQQQQQGLSPGNALTSPQAPPRHSRTTLPDSQVADSLQFSLFDRLPSFVEQMPSKWSVYNKPNNGYCEQSVEWNVHWLLDEDGQIAQSTLSDKSPPSENGNGTWIREVGDGGIGLDSVTLDDIEQLSIRIAEHALDISDDPIYF